MSGRGVLAIITLFAVHGAVNVSSRSAAAQNLDYTGANRIYASFDLSRPQGGPFPSDIFTVEDATQMTGRRINYPLPDCAVRPTDCDDLEMVNMLDGWGLQPRISIPFTGDVDPTTLNSDTVFVLDLADGKRIGINQPIWDPPTHTLHAESDKVLDQYHRYAGSATVFYGAADTTPAPNRRDAANAPVTAPATLDEEIGEDAAIGDPFTVTTAGGAKVKGRISDMRRSGSSWFVELKLPGGFKRGTRLPVKAGTRVK